MLMYRRATRSYTYKLLWVICGELRAQPRRWSLSGGVWSQPIDRQKEERHKLGVNKSGHNLPYLGARYARKVHHNMDNQIPPRGILLVDPQLISFYTIPKCCQSYVKVSFCALLSPTLVLNNVIRRDCYFSLQNVNNTIMLHHSPQCCEPLVVGHFNASKMIRNRNHINILLGYTKTDNTSFKKMVEDIFFLQNF